MFDFTYSRINDDDGDYTVSVIELDEVDYCVIFHRSIDGEATGYAEGVAQPFESDYDWRWVR